jgi:hypothetical protein
LFQSLATAAAKNIKLIVSYEILNFLSTENINLLKAHKGLAGYYIADEPLSSAFATLSNTVNAVQAIDNKHFCYINLFPYYNRWSSMNNYLNDYLKPFIQQVPVPVLSFDQYPITSSGGSNRSLSTTWYNLLEVFSAQAKAAGKPFWAFALASAHQNYPVPTLADLRLQVYSDLAYGAQCIQYYTYYKECFRTGEADTYIAPVQCDHSVTPYGTGSTKTEAYYTIKEMNAEIKALSPVFKNAQMIWVKHTGTVPTGCTAYSTSNLPAVFTSLNITGGAGALVSLMEKGDNNYLVIVNRNINNNITVQASGSSALQRVKKDATTIAVESTAQTVTPGDVIIYTWKK